MMTIPTVVMFDKNKQMNFKNTSVIVVQVSSEAKRDWSPACNVSGFKTSEPAKDQSSGKN